MYEIQLTNSKELQIELINPEKETCNIEKWDKKNFKEIIKRVFIGNYEDSKNVILLNNTSITHILIIRYSKEDYTTRINFPHKFKYYIIDLNNEFGFTSCSHFKYLLDEILFENNKNKIFIHSYFSLKYILYLLIFYIVTTLNYEIDDVILYIKKIVTDFVISNEEADKIYYFTKRHKLTYFPGEYTSYLDVTDNIES
ncbi:conserved Plasmodium protein, unknown function [Plasmodium gallinaceum]|uniref:Uncharacterized protein n=1 Tax=Plasmodium gallinaceum TaxID=5849 RepID=A0A1J1H053_PLAGA|nr:conserved Plasmodium protein, unknown function [Plasmodium gallinaceum]CRG96914.1 conserved Plasmodium protein, unknown function [Plasmodium gallinaceum]